jgi:hypothetical protein
MQRMERRRAMAFLTWLWANREAVRAHGSRYDEREIRSSTELVQFEIVSSFIILATRQRTAYSLAGTGQAVVARTFATLVTLIFGWWSLHGLAWTIMALVRNLGSGSRTTVEAVLAAIEADPNAKH